jgi:hypothetical protein
MTEDKQKIPTPRVCVTCQYFSFWEGRPRYSKYTPGESASMCCDKGYWQFDFNGTSANEANYRKTLLTALSCDDYLEVK